MKLCRYTRKKLLALIGAGVILFAQFAVAAHACMVMEPAQEMSGAAAMGDESPPCHDADPGEINACLTHCQAGVQQSFDSQPVPFVALMPVVAYRIDRQEFSLAPLAAESYAKLLLTRVTAPPAMVRNCCLRT